MARKPSTSLQYFPIKVNNHADTCIEALIDEFGIYAELFVLKVHDIIYNHSFYVQLDAILLRKLLRRTGFDEETARRMLDRMMEYEMLDRDLYEKYGILTGKEIQEVFFEATVRRKEFPAERDFFLIDTSCYERKHQAAARNRQSDASVADNCTQLLAEEMESDNSDYSDYSANNSAHKSVNVDINSNNAYTNTQRERDTKRENKTIDSCESNSNCSSSVAANAAHNNNNHSTRTKKHNNRGSAGADDGADKTLYEYPTIAYILYCEPRWRAGVVAQFGIRESDLRQLMYDFLSDAVMRGTDSPKTRTAFAAHFSNWLKKKYEIERKNLSQDLAVTNRVTYKYNKWDYDPVEHADTILQQRRDKQLSDEEYDDMIKKVFGVPGEK